MKRILETNRAIYDFSIEGGKFVIHAYGNTYHSNSLDLLKKTMEKIEKEVMK